ncbi:MAG: hypothetical protein ABIP78_12970 [Pyrinomonadaceae bacterium]
MKIKNISLIIVLFALQIAAQVAKAVVRPTPKPMATPPAKNNPPAGILEAITSDGNKVILKADKTWDYSKSDPITNISKENPPLRKLEVPFNGDDLQEVMAFYKESSWTLAKSQYETEREYTNRVQRLVFESKGVKKAADEIVFVIDGEHRYDAEKEVFFYWVTPYPSPLRFVKNLIQGGYESFVPSVSFKMPLAQAKTNGYKMKVAVFGYPVVKLDERFLTNPNLSFFVKRILVFNTETGEVYYELKL